MVVLGGGVVGGLLAMFFGVLRVFLGALMKIGHLGALCRTTLSTEFGLFFKRNKFI